MKSLTHEEFIDKLAKVNPSVQVVGTYINRQTKIKISCKKCGKIIDVLPNNLFHHSGLCRECSKLVFKPVTTKTHEEFIKELSEINPNVTMTEILLRQIRAERRGLPHRRSLYGGRKAVCAGRHRRRRKGL